MVCVFDNYVFIVGLLWLCLYMVVLCLLLIYRDDLLFERLLVVFSFFFFKQKTAYEMRISDWSSDVCSSDLQPAAARGSARSPGQAGRVATSFEPQEPQRIRVPISGIGKSGPSWATSIAVAVSARWPHRLHQHSTSTLPCIRSASRATWMRPSSRSIMLCFIRPMAPPLSSRSVDREYNVNILAKQASCSPPVERLRRAPDGALCRRQTAGHE